MALTLEERFEAAEEDINRILEILDVSPTVDLGIKYGDLEDERNEDLVDRISLLEKRLASCRKKLDIVKSKRIK